MKALKLKLTGRIMVSVLSAVLIMNLLILLLIGISSSKQANKAGLELAVSKSQEVASKVEVFINQAVESLNTLSSSFIAIKQSNNPDRDLLRQILLQNLKSNKSYLAAWHMWEPNAFDAKDAAFLNHPLYNECGGLLNLTYYRSADEYMIEKGTSDQYNEDYWLVPIKNKKLTILEPFMYSFSGNANDSIYETSIVKPINIKEKILGVVAIDIELDALKEIIDKENFNKSGFSVVITNELQIAANPDKNLRGKNLSILIGDSLKIIKDSIQSGKTFKYIDISKQTGEKVLRCFSPIKINESLTPWSVMTEIPMDEVEADSHNLVIFMILIGFVGILLISLLMYFITRRIISPIKKSADFAKEIAAGNLDAQLDDYKRDDEIGEMTIAQQEMAKKLKEVVSNIFINAENIFSASQHLNSTSMDMAQGANEQASSAEELSASMEQMVSNIEQNSSNASQTEQIAFKAAKDIEQASSAVITTVEAMRKIAEKISIIGVIAEKTDLLAINAAIEAARAGDQGKGFAVVATEIRKLAERSQEAAKHIDELTKSSVDIAEYSGTQLKQVVPDIQRTSVLVQEISAASMEQNSGSGQINNALMQLNAVTQRNAAASEEMSSSSEELHAQAEQLKDIIAFYKMDELKSRIMHSEFQKDKKSVPIITSNKKKPVNLMMEKESRNEDDFEDF